MVPFHYFSLRVDLTEITKIKLKFLFLFTNIYRSIPFFFSFPKDTSPLTSMPVVSKGGTVIYDVTV